MKHCTNTNCKQNNPQPIDLFYKNYSSCKECVKYNRKNYYIVNKIKQKEQTKQYDINHKDNLKKRQTKYNKTEKGKKTLHRYNYAAYHKRRYDNDIQFKLKVLLRARLRDALKTNQKIGSAVKDLGCSIEFFKTYIENKFELGMDWNNHGKWHIDHIIPLSNFDLMDKQQLLKACHYTNLQPLWAIDNLTKSNKI